MRLQWARPMPRSLQSPWPISFVRIGAPSNRTATLESQMIPMIQDVSGRTLRSANAIGILPATFHAIADEVPK
jgi:hypothetical protein